MIMYENYDGKSVMHDRTSVGSASTNTDGDLSWKLHLTGYECSDYFSLTGATIEACAEATNDRSDIC